MSWEQQYRRLVQLTRTMPEYPEFARDEAHQVSGCEATVWMYLNATNPTAIELYFDSRSRIVKGLLGLIQQQLDGQPLVNALQFDLDQLFAQEGLQQHLTPSRANGLAKVSATLKQQALRAQSLK